jgi:hypothetical protein
MAQGTLPPPAPGTGGTPVALDTRSTVGHPTARGHRDTSPPPKAQRAQKHKDTVIQHTMDVHRGGGGAPAFSRSSDYVIYIADLSITDI